MLLDRAMRRFCGFPTGVITLPIVTPSASVINKTLGLIRICFESPNIIGVAVRANVSLTRKAERRPIPNSTNAKARCGVLASLIILAVRYSRSPDSSIAATIENIPRRKKITSKLIEAYASCRGMAPEKIIATAPASMMVQIGILNRRKFLRAISA